MQRRLDLAMTLMGSPRIIFLDEPTTGLDPRGRLAMWEVIRSLVSDQAITILLTTQYLDEADELADEIAVLDQGKIVAQGTPDQLKQRVPGGHLLLTFSSRRALESAASRLDEPVVRSEQDLTLRVPANASARAVLEVLSRIDADDVPHVALHTPDLNDVFLALTSHTRKDQS
jgi:ABC-2 type transport system ATP-binding protein